MITSDKALLFEKIESELAAAPRVVVCIDGRAASGKTTLANELCCRFGGAVVHTDDFFLRPEQRTAERLAEAGGNIDYERFIDEAVAPIRAKKAFSYRKYDCHAGDFGGSVDIPEGGLIVIEGAYSLHPKFAGICDISVFLTVAPEEQMRRIALRNGENAAKRFKNEWIPAEERYFDVFSVLKSCEFVLETRG